MKPPTMPLSTVVVLNKVGFVDLVTTPELRKFDIFDVKKELTIRAKSDKRAWFQGSWL